MASITELRTRIDGCETSVEVVAREVSQGWEPRDAKISALSSRLTSLEKTVTERLPAPREGGAGTARTGIAASRSGNLSPNSSSRALRRELSPGMRATANPAVSKTTGSKLPPRDMSPNLRRGAASREMSPPTRIPRAGRVRAIQPQLTSISACQVSNIMSIVSPKCFGHVSRSSKNRPKNLHFWILLTGVIGTVRRSLVHLATTLPC